MTESSRALYKALGAYRNRCVEMIESAEQDGSTPFIAAALETADKTLREVQKVFAKKPDAA